MTHCAAVTKHWPKATWAGEGLSGLYITEESKDQKSGRKPEAGTEAKAIGMLIISLPPAQRWRVGTAHKGLGLPHQSLIRKMPPKTCLQGNHIVFSTEVLSFQRTLACVKLTKGGKKSNSRHTKIRADAHSSKRSSASKEHITRAVWIQAWIYHSLTWACLRESQLTSAHPRPAPSMYRAGSRLPM